MHEQSPLSPYEASVLLRAEACCHMQTRHAPTLSAPMSWSAYPTEMLLLEAAACQHASLRPVAPERLTAHMQSLYPSTASHCCSCSSIFYRNLRRPWLAFPSFSANSRSAQDQHVHYAPAALSIVPCSARGLMKCIVLLLACMSPQQQNAH